MNDWVNIKLKEIAKITMGQSPQSKYYNNIMEGMEFLQGNKTFGFKYPSFELYTTSIKKISKKGEVLMSVRAPVGDLNLSPKDICIGRGLCSITLKSGNNEYLYYLLKANVNRLINNENGTVFGSVNKNDIENFEVLIPKNINTQQKICDVLKTIDDKIINNKILNQNLEQQLMLIFKSWFILFERYDKNQGMCEVPDFGEIPQNWSVEYLENYVNFVTGVEPGSKNYFEKYEDNLIPFIRVGDLGSQNNLVYIKKENSKNKLVNFNDILLSLDATIGLVKMGFDGAYSTGMRKLVITNDLINKPFLYCLIKSEYIQNTIKTYATGTTILHAGKSIKHMKFVLPPRESLNNFNKIGEPILNRILNNMKEIKTLTKLRDILLPKLMSGEIDVSDIEV